MRIYLSGDVEEGICYAQNGAQIHAPLLVLSSYFGTLVTRVGGLYYLLGPPTPLLPKELPYLPYTLQDGDLYSKTKIKSRTVMIEGRRIPVANVKAALLTGHPMYLEGYVKEGAPLLHMQRYKIVNGVLTPTTENLPWVHT